MRSTRGLEWLARGALLASAFIIPACSYGNNGLGNTGAGTTTALWNATSGAAGTSAADGAPGALLWNDPNTEPIPTGSGGGNLTYGQADPTDYGPAPAVGSKWMSSALSTNAPENPTTAADEQAIEGYALAYHASLINVPIGGGGNLGIGIVNQQPPLYSSQNMELEPRAYCETWISPVGLPNVGLGAGGNGLPWRLQQCGINSAMQAPAEYPVKSGAGVTTAQQAWNAMAATADARIANINSSGYCGAGSWNTGGVTAWDFTIIDLPLGQSP